MRSRLALASALLAALPATAQRTSQLPDPANLAGERTAPHALADTLPINHGAPALQQLLLKLRSRASLLFIVAHPDDEDGGMLTFESRGAGARVGMLTLTRGEGGQNLMTADFNDALGLIRTQELLAEDRYTGVDQFFGTEVDFGFSKTREEALAQWTHDRVLYDAVRVVRLYRPLVLASTFVGGPTDGHGHHQVAGEITQEVFLAAADPKVFPEMGLPPWAPRKVYARVPFSRVGPDGMFDYATGRTVPTLFHNYVTGQDVHTAPEATVLIHEGDAALLAGKPALGMESLSWVQFARKGLARQKTQIGSSERLPPAGRSDTGYTLMASRVGPAPASEASLFEGIDTSLPALAADAPTRAALSAIDARLAEAQNLFDPANLELTAPPLRDALRALDTLLASVPETNYDLLHELRIKRVELNDALVLAHGLALVATLTEPANTSQLLTSTGSLAATLDISNGSANSIQIVSTQLTVNLAAEGIGGGAAGKLEPASSKRVKLRLPYLAGLAATRPYFSRPGLEQPFYNLSVDALRNSPATPDAFVARAVLDDQGVRLELVSTLPTPGSPTQPLITVPRLSLVISPRVRILPISQGDAKPVTFSVDIRTNVPEVEPRLDLDLPESWKVVTPEADYTLAHPGDTHTVEVTVQPMDLKPSPVTLQAYASEPKIAERTTVLFGYRPVGYPGLLYTNFFTPATLKAMPVNVTTAPGLRIGYLAGTGDEVAAFLPNLGVTPTVLTADDLSASRLAQFDAILLGVRFFAAHHDLDPKLLRDFADGGGVVIAQYDSAGFNSASAPFPYTLPGDSAHNVVVEAQPVALLDASAPLLTWPNAITSADFDGWIEERGHGFASAWDPHFVALLETHDPEQDPQKGGLLVAKAGKGAWIYCAFALYRQLPEGVPGAYRLMSNLLSYAKNPSR